MTVSAAMLVILQQCNVEVNVNIYIAHYRTVPLMRSVHRVLLKQMRLQQTTEAGDVEIRIAQL